MTSADTAPSRTNDFLAEPEATGLQRFTHLPRIRQFSSLLTDDELSNVGLVISPDISGRTLFLHHSDQTLSKGVDDLFAGDAAAKNLLSGAAGQLTFIYNFNWNRPHSAHEAVAARLDDLPNIAKEEGIPFNRQSRDRAKRWLKNTGISNAPSVYLLANGNTRLVWSQGDRQMGIQFIDKTNAQFVSLANESGNERVFGTAAISKLANIIQGLEMDSVVGL